METAKTPAELKPAGPGRPLKNGTVMLYCPNHPRKDDNGMVKASVVVWEKNKNEWLKPDQVVYHIDGKKTNLSIDNLIAMMIPTRDENGRRDYQGGEQCSECEKLSRKCIMSKGRLMCLTCYNKEKYLERTRDTCSVCGNVRRLTSKKGRVCQTCDRKKKFEECPVCKQMRVLDKREGKCAWCILSAGWHAGDKNNTPMKRLEDF